MLCEHDPAVLSACLDGELPAQQQIAIEAQIASCTQCAAEVAALMSLRRNLAPARNRFAPTPAFRLKMQQQIAATVSRRPANNRLNRPRLMAVAFALAAMLILGIGWLQYSSRSAAFSQIADLHVIALASANPYDVVSSDRHTVKPWFQGKLPFSFNIPEFAGSGFTLLGGRLVYLHQQPGAQLIIGMNQHKISILIFQDSSTLDRTFPIFVKAASRNAFTVASWKSQNLRFFVIGDTEPQQIDRLVQSFKQANQEE